MGMYYDLHTVIPHHGIAGYNLAGLENHNIPKELPFVRELTMAELVHLTELVHKLIKYEIFLPYV